MASLTEALSKDIQLNFNGSYGNLFEIWVVRAAEG